MSLLFIHQTRRDSKPSPSPLPTFSRLFTPKKSHDTVQLFVYILYFTAKKDLGKKSFHFKKSGLDLWAANVALIFSSGPSTEGCENTPRHFLRLTSRPLWITRRPFLSFSNGMHMVDSRVSLLSLFSSRTRCSSPPASRWIVCHSVALKKIHIEAKYIFDQNARSSISL